MQHLTKLIILFLLMSAWPSLGGCVQRDPEGVYSADMIIYGGTSAAISAAVQATRSGKTVMVVSPDTHLGGLSSGGIARSISLSYQADGTGTLRSRK